MAHTTKAVVLKSKFQSGILTLEAGTRAFQIGNPSKGKVKLHVPDWDLDVVVPEGIVGKLGDAKPPAAVGQTGTAGLLAAAAATCRYSYGSGVTAKIPIGPVPVGTPGTVTAVTPLQAGCWYSVNFQGYGEQYCPEDAI